MKLIRAGIVLAMAGLALSQTAPVPEFDVASIKPHELPPNQFTIRMRTGPNAFALRTSGSLFTEKVATVQDLIMDAYGLPEYRIIGLGDWMKAPAGEHFDIEARAPGDEAPSQDQLRVMLQNLLADRFQLQLHREMRPVPVYALVAGKTAPKVRKLTQEEWDARPRYARMPERFPELTASTMPMFADSLSRQMGRPVLDETGLEGYYEFATPEWMQPNRDRSVDPQAAQSAVISELESRIGLKLEPKKDPVEVLVIDHVERPSAN